MDNKFGEDNPMDQANIFELDQADANNDIQDILGQINTFNKSGKIMNKNNEMNFIEDESASSKIYNKEYFGATPPYNIDSSGGGLQSLISEINQELVGDQIINLDDI